MAATDKATRNLIADNYDKYLMRKGHPVRILRINESKFEEFEEYEDLPLSELMLQITDVFMVRNGDPVEQFLTSVVALLGQDHKKKIVTFSRATLDGEVCNFG